MTSEKPMRLDQMLSRHGYCSRSESRGWLKAGRVTVLGVASDDPGQKARCSEVRVDGQPVECPEGLVAVFHKPAGYTCTRDEREGPTVFDLVPERWSRRNPPVTTVGRLDKDTTGVLVITDRGELVQRWTSPRHKVPKVYEVTVNREIDPALVEVFANGACVLPGEIDPCAAARLEILDPHHARLELTEGRYHQVKRMFAAHGMEVTRLHRSRFGPFELDGLVEGAWRFESVE